MPHILFTTPGSGSWIKPAGVTRVEIECWGAGGNGGTRTAGTTAGGGGGGAYSANMSGLTTNYTEGELVVPYYVAPGGESTDTTWGKNSSAPEWNVYNRVKAQSGRNGGINIAGAGGAALSGDGTTLYSGGSGGASGGNFAAGGGAAGELGNGGNASGTITGSGNGIYSGNGGSPNVNNAGLYGGGGGGGLHPGRQGLIRIYYEYPAVTYFEIGSDFRNGTSTASINPTDGANRFRKL